MRVRISGVQVSQVTGSSALATWDTAEPSDSLVVYGPEPPGAASAGDPALVTAHAVPMTGLGECTLHFFSVSSTDAAGNVAADDNGGSLFTFSTGSDNEPMFGSADTPVAIPDNDPGGASSTITLAETDTVLGVRVRVDITHTYTGDLSLFLDTPGGTILLSNRRGGGGNDFIDTLFDVQRELRRAATATADDQALHRQLFERFSRFAHRVTPGSFVMATEDRVQAYVTVHALTLLGLAGAEGYSVSEFEYESSQLSFEAVKRPVELDLDEMIEEAAATLGVAL